MKNSMEWIAETRTIINHFATANGSAAGILHQGNQVEMYQRSWTRDWLRADGCGVLIPLESAKPEPGEVQHRIKCKRCFPHQALVIPFSINTRDEQASA